MPAIFEPDSDLGYGEVWCALSGGDAWGGANIWVSANSGTSYTCVGRVTSNAKQGLLTANFPNYGGTNPDTVDTLSVDLTESRGILQPVSHADADAFRTLSVIQPQPISNVIQPAELIAYGNVSTTSTYGANLTYIYRGLYGSARASHNTGEQFTLIDITGLSGSVVKFNLPVQYIGQALLIKFQSVNLYGLAAQDLSSLTAYQYTPTGRGYGLGVNGAPLTPTGLTATSGNGQNILSWNGNAPQDNVLLYTLYAAPGLSQPFSSAVAIWSGNALTYAHSGIGNSASYTYFLTATNAAGTSPHTAGVNGTSGSTGVGTVTSVAAGAGIQCTPNPITGVGTVALGPIASGDFLANISGSTGVPSATTLSAYLDFVLGNTVGSMISRTSSGWLLLGPGTAGQVLTMSGGLPTWVASAAGANTWLPLVSGSEPPIFITDGAGDLITVAYSP